MHKIIEEILSISKDVRYIAIYNNESILSFVKPDLGDASSSESDKYEELIVNPTLLTLVRQRGNIDCGGVEFILIRYGNFYQYVRPFTKGHISICIAPEGSPLELASQIERIVARRQIEL
jgi:hypothetical protein